MAWPEAWRALAAKELAGPGDSAAAAARLEALAARTLEGLTVEPFYGDGPLTDAAAGGWPGRAPFVRGAQAPAVNGQPWWNVARLVPGPAAAARLQALEELEGGACGLELPAEEAGWSAADLRSVLAEVRVDAVALRLEPGPAPAAAVTALLGLARDQQADGAGWSFGLDLLRHDPAVAADLGRAIGAAAPRARAFVADSTPFHEAGAHAVTELALLLGATAETLRALEESWEPQRALAACAWRLPAERDFFGGVAKLRAARWLWSRMAAACGAREAPPPFLHVLTSPRTHSRRDPHVNLLRATVQAAAAVTGGADALCVQAFDAESDAPSALGRRLARSLQLVLQHEAGFGAIADPAGGSPHLEDRTRALAQAAWEEFRGLERRGGLRRALQDGSLRAQLDREWDARRARIASGAEAVVGVNLHAERPAAAASAAAPIARALGRFDLPRRREEDACPEGA